MKIKHIVTFSYFVFWREVSIALIILGLPLWIIVFHILDKPIKEKLKQLPKVLADIRSFYNQRTAEYFSTLK